MAEKGGGFHKGKGPRNNNNNNNYKHKKNPYLNLREKKANDIRKAITHRSRLRKKYFQLLKEEGLEERPKEVGEDKDQQQHHHKEQPKKNPTNFAERAKKVKERKEEKRQAKLESVRDKRRRLEESEQRRELVRSRVTQKTSKGQPLMGPKINNLLDKIRKDMDDQ
ncbi:rRNA-processing protein fyv7 [Scheffersomyces spartinae]|uniref:rRNA-processing protein FYV7 n=1 Tax=Scheffersomyces spartinae TaxID=45513 RepID=A0A9P7V7M7_9ASCO|nr:rRNA-processing protein fyv7 [Scheffersomyces spartinae]KAG7192860.1 rRNA-processing protein fyv7 [Scheffersomyces spartinae]